MRWSYSNIYWRRIWQKEPLASVRTRQKERIWIMASKELILRLRELTGITEDLGSDEELMAASKDTFLLSWVKYEMTLERCRFLSARIANHCLKENA